MNGYKIKKPLGIRWIGMIAVIILAALAVLGVIG